jgi:hypothetical protein
MGAEERGKRLTRSQITTLTTTANDIGSFFLVGNQQQLQSLQQTELEAGEYTVQFQVIEPVIDTRGFATYAIITWKVDGQQLQRVISVFSGAAISGVCDSVHVKLVDQSGRIFGIANLPGGFSVTNGSPIVTATVPQSFTSDEQLEFLSQPGVQYSLARGVTNATNIVLATPYTGVTNPLTSALGFATYKVGVTLSKGTRPTTMQPPTLLTIREQAVGGGASVNISIPKDAGVLSVLITPAGATFAGGSALGVEASVVQFFDANAQVLAGFMPGEFPFWYPVPPGTDHLSITNGDPANATAFGLQWGIEG